MQDATVVLAELSSARTPWLALALAGPAARSRLAEAAGDATVIDITDPRAVPVMVNPLEPAPGYPVLAHAGRLAGLFEAAFGLDEPVATAVRAGLRRAYADCGWDMRTGAARPGAVSPPAIPAFRQLKLATVDAARDLGYDASMRAAVRGFLEARLDALWAGAAGLFLEGGHPASLARLLRGSVLVTGRGLADEEAASFLAGVLLLRLAGQLSHPDARPYPPAGQESSPDDRDPAGVASPVIVVAVPDRRPFPAGPPGPGPHGRPGAARSAFLAGLGPSSAEEAWFGRVLEDLWLAGADIVTVIAAGDRSAPGRRPGAVAPVVPPARVPPAEIPPAEIPPGVPAVSSLLAGRRSAACGDRCGWRPCHGYEVHTAGLLADDPGQAWLRLWVRALLLAFLTGRPVPGVPAPLRAGGDALSPRGRECLLATVIDAAVAARAPALRACYDPRSITAVVAAVAGRMLADAGAIHAGAIQAGDVPGPVRAGSVWVIPQFRWLHEMERLSPLGRDRLRPDDIAPPLDFGLAGLPDWPGIRVTDRLEGLRGHPLAMESELNRTAAMTALLGGGRADLDADLALTGMGVSPPRRLRHAARAMGAAGHGGQPGWLEVVLSWPARLIGPAAGAPAVPEVPGEPENPEPAGPWTTDVPRAATG